VTPQPRQRPAAAATAPPHHPARARPAQPRTPTGPAAPPASGTAQITGGKPPLD
jgi:hypothetical protein